MVYKKVKYRRHRKGKTDYKARIALLKSDTPRVIVRKTNKYIIMQLAVSKGAQDSVLITANSKELLVYGFPTDLHGSLKSLPAAYLTGVLLGAKIKKNKKEIKKVVADLGLQRSTKGSRIYAAIKGLLDAGVDVPCSEEMFPDSNRLQGKHMKKPVPIDDIKRKIGEK